MMMQKVKEIITTENSFFGALQTKDPFKYNELFFDIPTDELDMMLLVNCGERYAAPLLVHHDINKVVSFVVNKYLPNWERVNYALFAEYDIFKPYHMKQVTTGEKTSTQNTTGESQDKSGVVGFDSEVATDSTVDTNNNTVNIAQTDKDNTTVETTGNTGNYVIPDVVAKEMEVRKHSFIQIVINDIQSQITLDIY